VPSTEGLISRRKDDDHGILAAIFQDLRDQYVGLAV
jgi:hypothetical protein